MTRAEWVGAFCAEIGVDAPTADEEAQLLELASIAAHSSERPAAPLACWAAGKTGRSPDELREIARAINPA
ncbi:MAG TPA: DUF6457 domain-containing protein [Solirubrobacterales bacterium]|jgi:hypothetical protein